MPDFNTRKAQGSDGPNRSRMTLMENRLSRLLSASKHRLLAMAGTLCHSLMANKLRSLLIGGVLIFVMVAVPVGLLIYTFTGFDHRQQTGSQQEVRTIPAMQKHLMEDIRIDENLKGKLVFQLSGPYQTPSNYAISTMNVNGSGLKQLTDTVDRRHMGYSSEDPARSPDLKKIAFTRLVVENLASGSASASAGSAEPTSILVPYVFIMNTDGSDEKLFVDRVAVEPDWSPDGKLIAFSSDEMWSSDGVSEDGDCDLYVASADGLGTFSRLTNESGCESNPSWSPDGKKITFTSERDGNLDVYVINACCEEGITNQPQQLTDDSLDDTDPAWSPDGAEIAFTQGKPASESAVSTSGTESPHEADVYKMDADGSGKVRLTYSKAIEAQSTWSPDGKKLAFTRQGFPGASPESGSMNATTGIFTMDADGTDPAVVKIFENQIASFPEWGGTVQQDKGAKVAVEDEPTEEAIADWRALDARMPDVAVQAYLEQMNELLRGVNLHDSLATGQESLATEMTSSALKGLDPSGKEKVVRFLSRAGLLPVIPINYTDLRGTDLSGANLSRANWSSDNLSGVNLSNANLSKATIGESNFRGADLSGANLSGAILQGDDFRGAELSSADLSGANLTFAKVSEYELAQAKSLADATMPNGTQHP